MSEIVLDIEIRRNPKDLPGSWDSTHLMGVSFACVWVEGGQRMHVYDGEAEGPCGLRALRQQILLADKIIGFNLCNFDYPVIFEMSRADWSNAKPAKELKERIFPKTRDILREIWLAMGLDPDKFNPKTHDGWGLDAVCAGTLSVRKASDSAKMPSLWDEKRYAEIITHCSDDVAMTRDLDKFIQTYGYVFNDKLKKRLSLPVGL